MVSALRATLRVVRPLILVFAVLLGIPAIVAGVSYTATITTINTSLTADYTMLAVRTLADIRSLVSAAFISASGLDTRVMESGTAIPHVLAGDRIMFATEMPHSTVKTLQFTTGNSALSAFYTIPGYGGSILTLDDADIELGETFRVEVSGYFDTSAVANIVYKQDSFRIYVQAAGNVRAAILSAGDVEDYAVDAAVASGEHDIIVQVVDGYLLISVDGVQQDSALLPSTVGGPATVASTGTGAYVNSYLNGLHRRIWYANGRYWAFKAAGTVVHYYTSTDGTTWSGATTIFTSNSGTVTWDVYMDGTYVYYVYGDNIAPVDTTRFRRGVPNSDGTITWDAEVNTGLKATGYESLLSSDSTGKIWLLYRNAVSSDRPTVARNANTDGTWTTDTGFPVELDTTVTSHFMGGIVSLDGGEMVVAWNETGTGKTYTKLWNGSAFGATEDALENYSRSLVADADGNVFTGKYSSTSSNLYSNKRTYSTGLWSANTDLGAGHTGTSLPASLAVSDLTGDVWMFVTDVTTDDVLYKKRGAVTGTWDAGWTTLVDESAVGINSLSTVSAYEVTTNSEIAVLYWRNNANPWDFRVAYLQLNGAPVPDTANNYSIIPNNTVPYMEYLKFTISGTQQLWYQPVSYIQGEAYSTGTVTVTNGDATVEGAGGMTWTSNMVGSLFVSADGVQYTISSVTDADTLELTTVYGGGTLGAQAYNMYVRLPDRSLTAEDAQLTFGSNPAGVTSTMGPLTSAGAGTTPSVPGGTTPALIPPTNIPSDVTGTGTGIGLPFYPLVQIAYDQAGIPEWFSWWLGWLLICLAVFVFITARTHHFVLGLFATLLVSGAFVASKDGTGASLLPWGMLIPHLLLCIGVASKVRA